MKVEARADKPQIWNNKMCFAPTMSSPGEEELMQNAVCLLTADRRFRVGFGAGRRTPVASGMREIGGRPPIDVADPGRWPGRSTLDPRNDGLPIGHLHVRCAPLCAHRDGSSAHACGRLRFASNPRYKVTRATGCTPSRLRLLLLQIYPGYAGYI